MIFEGLCIGGPQAGTPLILPGTHYLPHRMMTTVLDLVLREESFILYVHESDKNADTSANVKHVQEGCYRYDYGFWVWEKGRTVDRWAFA